MADPVQIKKYDVYYYGGGRKAHGHKYRAVIGLRTDGGDLLGRAYFHRDKASLPSTDDKSRSGYVSCHYRAEDFSRVLDVLRNEEPVYLLYEPGQQVASIETMNRVEWTRQSLPLPVPRVWSPPGP